MLTHTDLEGIIPAVIVPMQKNFSIDFDAYEKYIEWVISHKPVGLAVNVDTGEGPYLTPEERSEVIRVTKKVASGRCFIIAGVGGPSTAQAVNNAKASRDAGADAILVFPVAAFINTPLDPRVMANYHKSIADASGLPLVLFQLSPVFGGVNYQPIPLATTLALPEVIGLKDASFDPLQFMATRDIVRQLDRPITLLTGNDNFMLESFLLGATGALLGYCATAVGSLVEMLNAIKRKDFEAAVDMKWRVQGFCDEYIYKLPYGDYRARSKVALVHMGILTPEQTYVRPPFTSLWNDDSAQALKMIEKFSMQDG